jgi:E3 ubiquitin-protein ligase HERC2
MFQQTGVEARCWYASFVGEASIDAGGPFRESLDDLAKELESGVLPLLIKSPNNKNGHGSDRDCFILNPAARSPTHLEMFKFFGALLCFHIGTKAPTPIHLAPLVWKQILGDPLELEDLENIDAYSYQVLKDLKV